MASIDGTAAVIISTISRVESLNSSNISQIPKVTVSLRFNGSATELVGIADTGAQVCVAGEKLMKSLKPFKAGIEMPDEKLKHVGGALLDVIGSIKVMISLNGYSVDTVVYLVKGVQDLYLSLDVCKGLHLVGKQFPNETIKYPSSLSNVNRMHKRDTPDEIPYEPTEQSIPLLKKWLLDHFSSTVFNIEADILPIMKGEPHKIRLKKNAVPYAAHTPIPVPYHWKEEVRSQLIKDENNGIIQKAPVGEASEWCMRMITVPKSDGSLRRTIDFSPINKFCAREAHYTPTPFNAVNNLPAKVFKTTFDAYNGYHQVELDKDSVKYTTFITEHGRYQYLRTPQGHISSGDAYVRRFDEIIEEVDRKVKIVDDVLLYDVSIEDSFFHSFDFLSKCEENGATMNPTKFKFAQKRVDFVGYDVDWESFKPSDNTLSAIKDFPMPSEPRLVDIRSWYGLVNQIAPFITVSPVMAPFRDLLKSTKTSGSKVYWDDELKKIFEDTKEKLCNAMTEGLSFYDVRTCLITDFSQKGIGFLIMQKHCKCTKGELLSCCQNGWKLVLCKSRHLEEAEEKYMPIEGEALAIDWALKTGRLYLLGCEFEVLTDHKPLVKIFNDKPLNEVENMTVQTFKERSMAYSFQVKHIKGIKNMFFGDPLSRYPVNDPDESDRSLTKELAALNIASIHRNIDSIAVTVNEIKLRE